MFRVKQLLLYLLLVAPLIAEDATLPPSFNNIFGEHVDWFDKFTNISGSVSIQEVSSRSIEESDRRAALARDASPFDAITEHTVLTENTDLTDNPFLTEPYERYTKPKSKKILSRENRSTTLGMPNESTNLTNFTMIKITDFVTVTKIGIVHVTRADKRFKKKINFEQIDHSILGLLEIINGLDPNLNENDYTLIQGRRNSFHLMNFISHHGLAKTQCEESENSLIDLVTFEEENIKIDRQIILADIATIINGRLKCKNSDNSEVNDIACVRSIFNSAKALKLTVSTKSVRDFYQDILRSENNTVYNVVLNDTHISLVEDGIGYSICSNTGKTVTRVELHDILQGKFFSHLSEISRKLLNSFLHRNVKIQKTFLLAINKKSLGIGPLQSLESMCETITKLTLSDCSEFGRAINPNSEFDIFLTEIHNKSSKIDYYFSAVINKASTICNTKNIEGMQILFRVYKNLLSVHFSIDELFNSFLKNRKVARYPFFFSSRNTAQDVRHCLYEVTRTKLSDQDVKRLFAALTNIKSYFLYAFDDLLDEHLKDVKLLTTSPVRNKRWIWTDFLSVTTGLASGKSVNVLKNNQMNIVTHEHLIDSELIALNNETHELLAHLTNQSSKLKTLFEDENILSEHLNEVIEDEMNITIKLDKISLALEIFSDLSLQYQILSNNINLIPILLHEAEQGILSLLSQSLNVDLLPLLRPEAHMSTMTISSMMFSSISAEANANGFFIEYQIPVIWDSYDLLEIKTIPFHMLGNNTFYSLELDKHFLAANSKHFLFDFPTVGCRTRNNVHLCEGRHLNIHKGAYTCAEELVFGIMGLGPLCKNSMKIVMSNKQDYVHHHADPIVIVFTPFADTFNVSCDVKLLDYKTDYLQLTIGLNAIKLPQNCIGYSSQLVIFPDVRKQSDELIVSPLIESLNITENVLSVIDDLNTMHGINMSSLEKHIISYLNSSQVESMDIKEAAQQLDHFKTITKLKDYIPGTISLDDPDVISTTTSVLCWILALIILIASLACCIKCFKPCADCFALLVKCVKCCLPEKLCVQSKKLDITVPVPNEAVSIPTTNEPDISLSVIESTPINPIVRNRNKFRKFLTPRKNQYYSNTSISTEMTSISQLHNRNLTNHLQWFIDNTPCQIFLKSLAEGRIIIYNWITDKMETINNEPVVCDFHPPHYGIIIAAIKCTDELNAPHLILDDNDLQCLNSDPDIYFHASLNQFIRKSNNAIVCGIKTPPRPAEDVVSTTAILET